jgi:hypothetical protein
MMGGGRAEAFAEGGAMAIQAELSKDLFGIESGAHPHYVKGMLAKLQGGGYGDVVKAFYQSEISPQVALFKQGALTEEAFRQERERALKLAINRSKRIMSGAKDVKGVDFLTSSKDTVYLEQTLLAQKLNEAGVSFALNIVGVSLDNIIRLMKLGLLNPQNMVKLDLNFSKGIWEHQKAEYTL